MASTNSKKLNLTPWAPLWGLLFYVLLLFGFMGMLAPSTAHAGKGAYPVLINDISWDVCQILKKYGLPIKDRMAEENGNLVRKVWDQPYYRSDAATGHYTLLFFQADEIPQEAVIEIIRYCLDLYDKRGRNEKFKINMHREAFKPEIPFFSGRKPFFKLTIGGNN